jgi:hypothetical protein
MINRRLDPLVTLLNSTTFVHKYMTPLLFFENFDHLSYSNYLFKNVNF